MAFFLLSLETKYPPLFQSAVDMLVREGLLVNAILVYKYGFVKGAVDEIVEVLLAKGNTTDAIRLSASNICLKILIPLCFRYLESCSALDRVNVLKALDAAWNRGDRVEKYAVYSQCAEKKGRTSETSIWYILIHL